MVDKFGWFGVYFFVGVIHTATSATTELGEIDTVICGDKECGYKTSCKDSECKCDEGFSVLGTIPRPKSPVKFCVEACFNDGDSCYGNRTCSYMHGFTQCLCTEGYNLSWTGHCLDVDECGSEASPCGETFQCLNLPGSYTCRCHQGYRKEDFPDGFSNCTDIDECSENENICGDHGTCVNIAGSYNCSCEEGYRQGLDGNKKCGYDALGLGVGFAIGITVGITLLVWIMSFLAVVVVKSLKRCLAQKDHNSSPENSIPRARHEMVNYDALQDTGDSTQNNSNYTSLSGVTPSVHCETNKVIPAYVDVIGENRTSVTIDSANYVNGNLDNTPDYVNR